MINHETVIMESKRFPFEEYGGDINITQMRLQTHKFVTSKNLRISAHCGHHCHRDLHTVRILAENIAQTVCVMIARKNHHV